MKQGKTHAQCPASAPARGGPGHGGTTTRHCSRAARSAIFRIVAFGIVLAGLPALGISQTKEPAKTVSAPTPQSADPREDKAPKKSIRMEEIEILGEVEKPKAMFVIPMAPIEYRQNRRGKDFSAEILAPIDREAFENMERNRPPEGSPLEP